MLLPFLYFFCKIRIPKGSQFYVFWEPQTPWLFWYFFLGVNWSDPETYKKNNHTFYKTLGLLHDPCCKQPFNPFNCLTVTQQTIANPLFGVKKSQPTTVVGEGDLAKPPLLLVVAWFLTCSIWKLGYHWLSHSHVPRIHAFALIRGSIHLSEWEGHWLLGSIHYMLYGIALHTLSAWCVPRVECKHVPWGVWRIVGGCCSKLWVPSR